MKKTDFKGKFLTACAALFTVGAAVIRCIQLFYYTDLSTGYVVSGGKNLISELYLIIAVAVLLFAGVSFIFFNKKLRSLILPQARVCSCCRFSAPQECFTILFISASAVMIIFLKRLI